jgi:predicted dehydrogenase
VKAWKTIMQSSTDVEVAALCDIDDQKLSTRARELGIPARNCFSDYHDLLERADVNAVSILLPSLLHSEAALAAAQHEKHILVEKPLASNLAEADEMIQAAQHHDVTLMVAMNRRYAFLFRHVKALLDSCVLGDIFCVRGHHMSAFSPESPYWTSPSRRTLRDCAGGTLMELGFHTIDLLQWLVGDVTTVYAQTSREGLRGYLEGEDTSLLSLKYKNGAIGTVFQTAGPHTEPGFMPRIWIHGTNGALECDHATFKHCNQRYEETLSMRVPRERAWDDAWVEELRHFVECVYSGGTPISSGIDVRKTLEIVEAAYRSVENGTPVTLPL